MVHVEDDQFDQIKHILSDPNVLFPTIPLLLRDICVVMMPDELGVHIRGAGAPINIIGNDAAATIQYILRAADGSATLDEIFSRIPSNIRPVTLAKCIMQLHRKGLFCEGMPFTDTSPNDNVDVTSADFLYWERYLNVTASNRSASHVKQKLAKAKLLLFSEGAFGNIMKEILAKYFFHIEEIQFRSSSAETFAMSAQSSISRSDLMSFRRTVETQKDKIDLAIIATRHASSAFLSTANEILIDANIPFVVGNESAEGYDIGPYVLPRASACYECMRLRTISRIEFAIQEEIYQRTLQSNGNEPRTFLNGENPFAAHFAAGFMANEISKIVSDLAPTVLHESISHFDPITGTIESNRFRRVPHCPVCCKSDRLTSPTIHRNPSESYERS